MNELIIDGIGSDSEYIGDLDKLLEQEKNLMAEGIGWSFKSVFKKGLSLANKVAKLPIVGDFIPPTVKTGLKMGSKLLNTVAKAEKKTGRKVKWTTKSVQDVNSNAFLRGRIFQAKKDRRGIKLRGIKL